MITIKVRENGPYRVDGDEHDVRIIDWNGNEYRLPAKRPIALCRCGGSATKPFCDGTHSRAGFKAAEAAAVDGTREAPGERREAVPVTEDRPTE